MTSAYTELRQVVLHDLPQMKFIEYDRWDDAVVYGALLAPDSPAAAWWRQVKTGPRAQAAGDATWQVCPPSSIESRRYSDHFTAAEKNRVRAGGVSRRQQTWWLLLRYMRAADFSAQAEAETKLTAQAQAALARKADFPLWDQLFDGQKLAVAKAMANLRRGYGALLALETGTGKTLCTLSVLLRLAQAVRTAPPLRVLVCGPVAGAGVWARDVQKFDLPLDTVRLTSDSVADVTAQWQTCTRPLLVTVSYAHLATRAKPTRVQLWLSDADRRYDALVLDECHYVKNARAQRTRTALALSRRARWTLGLSATPLTRKPLDLWPQFETLHAGALGPRAEMARRYQDVETSLEELDADTPRTPVAMLQRDFGKYAIRVTKAEMLDLPGELDSETEVQLDAHPALARLYRTAERALDVWRAVTPDMDEDERSELLRTGAGSYAGPEVRWQDRRVHLGKIHIFNWMLKCSQILGGVVPVLKPEFADMPEAELPDDAHEYAPVPDAPKIRVLCSLLDDLPRPVVVVARWRAQMELLADLVAGRGERYAEVSGMRKDGLTAYSEMRPDVDLLGVQIASGSASVDLSRAAHAVYLDVGYNFAHYWQARGRIYRHGQRQKCTHHLLQCPDTVDDHVWTCMRAKKDIVSTIVESRRI